MGRGRETGVPLGGNTTIGSEAKSKIEFGFLPSEPIEKEKLSLNRGVLENPLLYSGGFCEIVLSCPQQKLIFDKKKKS